MKISIITPSFNGAKYLRQCLQSVQSQKGVEVEHIVQDAGSTDGTDDIVKEFPNVRYYSEPDKGMSDGINRGVRKATGDWWMWLNTDDYLLPDALGKVVAFVEKNPDADVVYFGFNFVDSNGKFIKKAKVVRFDRLMMIHLGCYIGSTATLFKTRSTVGEGLYLSTLYRQAMDQEYFARLGTNGLHFRHGRDIIAEFRIHGDNTSMRHIGCRDLDSIYRRQMQIAEGASVRRCYGITIFGDNPFLNGISDAILWYFFRMKKFLVYILQ